MRVICLALCLVMAHAASARGQNDSASQAPTPDTGGTAAYDDIKYLMDDIQRRIERLDRASSNADAALEFLSRQIAESLGRMSSRQSENNTLRWKAIELSDELEWSTATRGELTTELSRVSRERGKVIADLEVQVTRLADLLALERGSVASLRGNIDGLKANLLSARGRRDQIGELLADARRKLETGNETTARQRRELASLGRDVTALRSTREGLEARVGALTVALHKSTEGLKASRARNAAFERDLATGRERAAAAERRIAALRDRSRETGAQLSAARERNTRLGGEVKSREVRLKALAGRVKSAEGALAEEKAVSVATRRRVEILNLQIAALRRQLTLISSALEISDAMARKQQAQVVDLGRRLNRALASKVAELARYRSKFFGRLREVLGNRRDIRIVGDRFVFQSEVLFGSGSARLAPGGRRQVARLAGTLLEISRDIPHDIDWVLRVDGHTDRNPISTPNFPSNWELSTARATSVVKSLIELGVPPKRLAPTGFGEFRPLDGRDDEIAYRRNRRIEFKLTGR